MPKRPLSTDRAPPPAGPYSQAIAAAAFGLPVRDVDDFPTMNEVYRDFFPEPLPAHHDPVRPAGLRDRG